MEKEQLEAQIMAQYGVAVDQIYADNDKREVGRKIRVLGVTTKPGKASCASCTADGSHLGRTLWIRFDRLNSKAYTRVR